MIARTQLQLSLALLVLALAPSCGDDGTPAAASSTGDAPADSTSTVSTPAETTDLATTTTTTTTPPSSDTTTPPADTSTGDPPPPTCDGTFPRTWIDGTACGDEPLVQVHYYDPDTVILRQSLCTSFEAPFLYMLFGEDQVLLEDTGDGGIPIDDIVYGVIDEWLAARGRASIELLVVNSHAHGDHVQGNPLFEGQPDTTLVEPSVAGLSRYFGIEDWPAQIVQHELGNRTIDVIPIPGHQASHIALFDHRTGMLLTGDTLYPGRLYIGDFGAYVASIERLVGHVGDQEVCHVMGTHIEMTGMPGVDFPFEAPEHPAEHGLRLGVEHLVELRDAVLAMGDTPQYEVHDDFIVYPL